MEQGQNRNRAASKPHAKPLPDPSDTLATKRALNPKPDALRVGQWDRLHVTQSPVSNNPVVTHSREKQSVSASSQVTQVPRVAGWDFKPGK